MKLYRKIVIFFAALLGVLFFFFMMSGEAVQNAIKNPPTEAHYKLLKENAIKVAETLDVSCLSDEEFSANFYFSDKKLNVVVKSSTAEITAKIPISPQRLSIKDKTLEYLGNLEFENANYEITRKLDSASFYILISAFGGIFVAMCVYTLGYEFVTVFQKKENNQKRRNK